MNEIEEGNGKKEKKRPIRVFRHGQCFASVFVNEVKHIDGRTVEVPRVSFAKLYTKQGRQKRTTSLDAEDVLSAILALGEAREWIRGFEEDMKKAAAVKQNGFVVAPVRIDMQHQAFNPAMEVMIHE